MRKNSLNLTGGHRIGPDSWRSELTGKIALIDNRREVIGLTLKKIGLFL
jgi:hypothetical protein